MSSAVISTKDRRRMMADKKAAYRAKQKGKVAPKPSRMDVEPSRIDIEPSENGVKIDFSANFIDIVGAENIKSMFKVATDLALDGDKDLLKTFLGKAFDASSKGSTQGSKEMEERMKQALDRLNKMSEREVQTLVGEYWLTLKAGRMPVAKSEE